MSGANKDFLPRLLEQRRPLAAAEGKMFWGEFRIDLKRKKLQEIERCFLWSPESWKSAEQNFWPEGAFGFVTCACGGCGLVVGAGAGSLMCRVCRALFRVKGSLLSSVVFLWFKAFNVSTAHWATSNLRAAHLSLPHTPIGTFTTLFQQTP